MKVHKFIHEPNSLHAEGCRILEGKEKYDDKFIKRVTVLKEVFAGLGTAEAAERFGVSTSSINLWVKKADEQGFDSLIDKHPTGRPHLLTSAQYEQLISNFKSESSAFDLKECDSTKVCKYVNENFKIVISGRTALRIINRMRSTLQSKDPRKLTDSNPHKHGIKVNKGKKSKKKHKNKRKRK